MRLAAVLSILVLVSACSTGERGRPTVTQPSTVPTSVPPTTPPPAADRVISVGEEVRDTLIGHGSHRGYELTAPSDGILVVQLSWDTKQGSLALELGDTYFAYALPIIAKLEVSAARRYLVTVSDSAPWDYDELFVPFVLTTSME